MAASAPALAHEEARAAFFFCSSGVLIVLQLIALEISGDPDGPNLVGGLSPLVPHLLGLSAVSSTRCKCGAACEARLLVFCGHELVLAAWFVMSVDEMGPLASGDFDQVSSCQLAPLCDPSGPLHPLAVIDCLVSTSCCCFRGHISGFNAAIRLEY